jgi:anti-sigma B factor antagonist
MKLMTETVLMQDIPVIRCSGRLVYGEDTAALCRLVEDALAAEHRCVLNLSGVTHVDGHGIGILVQLWRTARVLGGSLKLAGAPRNICEVLETTAVSTLLDCFDSETAAVGACFKQVA